MRWLIGLGNPGREYEGTRHNVGFDAVDVVADRLGATFRMTDAGAAVASTAGGRRRGVPDAMLVKPWTYMNLSGGPVAAIAREHGLDISEALVVVDDLHVDLGRLRVRGSGSDGGHNGLKSIIGRFGQGFARLRLGIGPAPERMPVEEFVLRRFRPGERRDVEDAIWRAAEAAEEFLRGADVETLMNRYNGQQT